MKRIGKACVIIIIFIFAVNSLVFGQLFGPAVNYGAGDGPSSVFTSDLNDNGDINLTIANYITNTISILLNNGDGTFQNHIIYSVGYQPRQVAALDYDLDGDNDLTVINQTDNNVSILNNIGTQ